ncbi:MAG: deoxyribodipyrimidine photo-lyase [Kouleothrix sp.]|nr:deoxyribodipyrimidine photo-lyase [Kouleothrix sp.]
MPTYIHWFRRDLRLRDNPALLAALRASAGRVVPVFVLDDAILRAPDTAAARVVFLLDSLRALDQALRDRGSRLIVRRGPPAQRLSELAEQAGAVGLCFNRDYTPFTQDRDQAVHATMAARGVEVRSFKDAVVVEAGELLTKAGTPYTVYTPYRRQWRARVEADGPPPDERLPAFAPVPEQIESLAIPSAGELGFSTHQTIPPGGEQAGLARLAAWSGGEQRPGIGGYQTAREHPAIDGTSRLSPYLRFGCVAPIACLRTALQTFEGTKDEGRNSNASSKSAETLPLVLGHSSSVDAWIGELAWRDFYYQILAHFPHVLDGAFRRSYDSLEWENDQRLFEAWRTGQTGYPIVDAAMRQLNAEAWMHNRARMIVASFLTKDLLIDWRQGERYFMQQLVDGDHASNNGGWQWAAGTGTDAQPYFRIFNPTSQGQKFDARGDYVRRYVPELAGVPERYIHTPWSLPAAEQRRIGVVIGRDYPEPVVDHATQRAQALALYRRARAQDREHITKTDTYS